MPFTIEDDDKQYNQLVLVDDDLYDEIRPLGVGGTVLPEKRFPTLSSAIEYLNSYKAGALWYANAIPYYCGVNSDFFDGYLNIKDILPNSSYTTDASRLNGKTIFKKDGTPYEIITTYADSTRYYQSAVLVGTSAITSISLGNIPHTLIFNSKLTANKKRDYVQIDAHILLIKESLISDNVVSLQDILQFRYYFVYYGPDYSTSKYRGTYGAGISTGGNLTESTATKPPSYIYLTPRKIVNYDPYADGGASDTGGGGGSFDGTTEVINEPDTPLVNVTATKFVSLYNPTESQLNNLAYFMWHTLDPTTWIKIVADPMDAIISLSVLPIAIPSSSASDISVGGISTGVSCNLASAQYISFDAGTITVPQYSNSYLDYAPYTTISIYLPYVGLRKIPTDLVMGKVLGVKYRIDIFTGACCVYITVGGSVILQFTGNCAQQIPFTSSNWTQAITTMISMIGSGVMAVANPATAALSVAGMANSAVNGLHADIETGGANGGNVGFLGVQKPYIIIQRPKQCIPANQNTFTGYPSYITATFGDLKGYTEVDKIILENINATENELNELESLLKGGVYVNEL